ncbi:hypothetical protein ACFXKW_37480 [Streptomyces sp. NPDC059193]|uniref:hypothetical protein n=1 Tax=Streptomyces sp. NPDC059193 TaxID=3346763 RepID=UPI00369DB697
MTTTSELPRGKPGASGRTRGLQDSKRGAPSRALRLRAADGWERFMLRAEFDAKRESTA